MHLRLKDSLATMVHEAEELGLSTIQFFFVEQATGKYVPLVTQDKMAFLRARRTFLTHAFMHSSYWINPASFKREVYELSQHLLSREFKIARELEIPYIVLHPGAARGYEATPTDPLGKLQGIRTMARMLNTVLRKERGVKILLENAAHGNRCIGNDLNDFIAIRELLEFPDRVGFCFDTAHAFSYGYALTPVNDLLRTLDKTMGLRNIKLIHLNDTNDAFGSKQDRHAFPGQGNIGKEGLAPLLNHPLLTPIPKIIEGPESDNAGIVKVLSDIAAW